MAFVWRVLVFCVISAAASAADPIRVGVSGPFTGPSAEIGVSMRDGIRIAVAEINAAGGVLGRPLEIVERDDAASNERGALVATELVEVQHVVATVGMVNTGVALASQRIYQSRRIPVITAVATGSLITRQFQPPAYSDNYVFRTACSDALQAAMIVDEAVDRQHLHRLAILHDASNYGHLGRSYLERALLRKGLRPVAVAQFRAGEDSLMRALGGARQLRAEGLLVFGVDTELARLPAGMAKIGWRVPVLGNWALSSPVFIARAGASADGVRMPQTYLLDDSSPRGIAFREAWRSRAQGAMASPSAAAQGYDAIKLLAAAIEQAGVTDGRDVRAALEDLQNPVEGIVSTYRHPFSVLNHEAITSTRTLFWGELREGEIRFAYDSDRRRAAGR